MIEKYEVGAPFTKPNDTPGVDWCTARIVGPSFDVLYYVDGPSSREIRTFTDALLRAYVWIYEDIPFIAVSYFGTNWTYDITLTVASRNNKDVSQAFIEGEGNTVNLCLIDASTNVLTALRTIGLPEDAVQTIKSAARAQIERYADEAEVLAVVNSVYTRMSTDDIIARGTMYEFKRK